MSATEGIDGNVYVISGHRQGTLPLYTEMYSPITKKWTQLAAPPNNNNPNAPAAATGPDGKIYRIGGGSYAPDGSSWSDTSIVDAYSPKAKTWAVKASMPTARGALAAVAGPDGLIYALGGLVYDPETSLGLSVNASETYNPTTNTWVSAPPMQQARSDFAAVIGPDSRVYVIGGEYDNYNTIGREVLSSVEAYSFTSHTWTYVAPLPMADDIVGATIGADGRIYAVGTNVYAYNVSTNIWTTLSAVPPPNPPNGYVDTVGPAVGMGSAHTLLLIENAEGNDKASAYTYAT